MIRTELEVPYRHHIYNGLKPMLSVYPTPILPENSPKKTPAVIICPGGSYNHCSYRESHPVALRFQSMGYTAFVLEYSCCDKLFPTALYELAAAVKYVRSHADEWNTDITKLAVCGFSAGGHLAASLGVHYASDFMTCDFDPKDIRPDALVLCYPVITAGEYSHKGSIESISAYDKDILGKISLEDHVSPDTPPVFIWHCADDTTVPVMNSLMFMQKLSENKVSFEGHIFPSGGHGLALADKTAVRFSNYEKFINPVAAQWFGLCSDWLERTLLF